MSDRRRNGYILLAVVALMLASVLLIAGIPGTSVHAKKTRLGLDLRGGVELVYQAKPTPQQPTIDAQAMDRALDILRKRVDKLGVAEPEIQRSGRDQINVGLPDVKNAARAINQVGKTAQLFFYDWEPNVIGPNGKPDPTNRMVTDQPLPSLYDAVLRASQRPPHRDANNTTNNQYYLFSTGPDHRLVSGPEGSPSDLYSELPRQRQPPGTRVLKVDTGTVVVKAEKPEPQPGQPAPKNLPDRWFVLNDDPSLNGTDLKNPEQNFDNGPGGTGQPIVTFGFSTHGRQQFQAVTRHIAQRGVAQQIPGEPAQAAFQHFAIVLDNQLVSRPYIDFNQNPDGIDGRTGAQISGSFTIQSAQDLANLLKIGALPVKLELISQSQVSATLGREALHQGLIAGAVGLGLVALFLIVFYRVLGLIAVAALGVYALYLYALINLIPITLTLPGIAGLILTIGVAADANIVIFERVKEEVRAGNAIPRAIAAGYKKGFSSILDANVVTLMTAFILFILATAGVKGFAFTLGVGTIVSLFTAVLATQAILGNLSHSRLMGRPSALGAGEQRHRWHADFMGASKWFFSMSGVILLIGALSIGAKGLNFGIDFESGTRITTALQRPATENQVRSVMAAQGFPDAKIQRADNRALGANVVQIATRKLQPAKVQQVRQALDQRFGVGNTFSNQSIGPTFGQTVARTAIIAIIASLLVISAYIALRFEWKYAVPVLIALMHDLLITGGVYSLTGREVTTATVAALLTILGYSLYDTIIVFDRIRENVPRMPRAAFSQIVNRSMSEVLTRSLATSFSTMLPVTALLLFGGETLKDFAFALLVGVASGTYSSIFIASPVLTHWKERERVYSQRAERIRRESGGVVPAYAVATVAGVAVDAPPASASGRRRERLTAPQAPEQISQPEFDELVRDLETDGDPGENGEPDGPRSAPPGVTSATAGARPTKPRKPKRQPGAAAKRRTRRHGRNR
ncbi:MAG TPA: protein translocase subunit SecD [Solirubrobacteraceae bacterium]|nr:protein translocase subunit SecD [Solirubrobacteraceae bacterium]